MLKASVMIPWPKIERLYLPYCMTQETKFVGLNSYSEPAEAYGYRQRHFQCLHASRIKWLKFDLKVRPNQARLSTRKNQRVVYEIFEQTIENRRQRIAMVYYYYYLNGFIFLEFDLNFWLKHFIYEIFPFLMDRLFKSC
jgi:hypothetical protein